MHLNNSNISIVHKEGDNYYLQINLDSNNHLHTMLSLHNCIFARQSLMNTDMKDPTINEASTYYTVDILLDVALGRNTLELKPEMEDHKVHFHSAKINLSTAVYLYDIIQGNT